MAPVFRYLNHPATWLTVAVLAVVLSAAAVWRGIDIPIAPEAEATPDRQILSRASLDATAREPTTASESWNVFKPAPGDPLPAGSTTPITERFRLAGTFFVLSAEMQPSARKAVLVDKVSGLDHIVQEGDLVDDVAVVTVAHDHVILQAGELRETLALAGGAGKRVIDDPASRTTASLETSGNGDDAVDNRFGKRVADNRWVFERDRLMDYYMEVMQSPRRLQEVFDSMAPLYDDQRRITGYQLDIQGEQDFFDAVGLRQGDVIRHVNDMAMSNRRRAEYLIGEFVHERLNVFVIDIERADREEHLIYEVR